MGIALCDMALYRSMVILGACEGILLQSLSAGMTAIFGACFLGEFLSPQAVLGIVVATLGVAVVVTDGTVIARLSECFSGARHMLLVGVALGLVAACTLAGSLIILKIVLQKGMSPLWAALVRISLGGAILWGAGLFRGWSVEAVRGLMSKKAVFGMLLCSNAFSAFGMWFAAVAVHRSPAGIAATLMGLQPIMVMLIGAAWSRTLPTKRGVAGTVIAFAGSALVCMR